MKRGLLLALVALAAWPFGAEAKAPSRYDAYVSSIRFGRALIREHTIDSFRMGACPRKVGAERLCRMTITASDIFEGQTEAFACDAWTTVWTGRPYVHPTFGFRKRWVEFYELDCG